MPEVAGLDDGATSARDFLARSALAVSAAVRFRLPPTVEVCEAAGCDASRNDGFQTAELTRWAEEERKELKRQRGKTKRQKSIRTRARKLTRAEWAAMAFCTEGAGCRGVRR